MAFKVAIFGGHVFSDAYHREKPFCNIHIDDNAQRALKLLGRYEMKSVVLNTEWMVPPVCMEIVNTGGLIDEIIFARDIKTGIREFLEQHRIHPCEALYVDDMAHGIRQAKQADIAATVALTGGYDSAERILKEDPRYLYHSTLDVAKLAYAQL